MGPGNIAGIALLAPLAMAAADRANIPPFLMAIMAGNGANAGALSPFAPTGVIASGLMTKIGLAATSGGRMRTTPRRTRWSVSAVILLSADGSCSACDTNAGKRLPAARRNG